MQTESIYAQGARAARFKVPVWAKLTQTAALALVAVAGVAVMLAADGWRWVSDASLIRLAITLMAAVLCAAVITWVVKVTGLFRWCLGITWEHKNRNADADIIFFYRGPSLWRPLGVIAALGLPLAALAGALWLLAGAAPVPLRVAEQFITAAPAAANAVPTHFWDYALLIPEDLLRQIEVQIPYEKGPPEKLLPRVTLIDAATRRPLLELFGKRPRQIPQHDVELIFHNDRGTNLMALWQFIPEMVRMKSEAGMTGAAARPLWERPELSLIHFRSGENEVTAIGAPWPTEHTSEVDQRLFLRAESGAIFQVRVRDPRLLPVVASARMTRDARLTLKERKEWAMEQVRNGLSRAFEPHAAHAERARLMLALVSLLTLDPRDPEAFFHLGKLAQDSDTIHAALRYGRDAGLEQAKLAELQAELENK